MGLHYCCSRVDVRMSIHGVAEGVLLSYTFCRWSFRGGLLRVVNEVCKISDIERWPHCQSNQRMRTAMLDDLQVEKCSKTANPHSVKSFKVTIKSCNLIDESPCLCHLVCNFSDRQPARSLKIWCSVITSKLHTSIRSVLGKIL